MIRVFQFWLLSAVWAQLLVSVSFVLPCSPSCPPETVADMCVPTEAEVTYACHNDTVAMSCGEEAAVAAETASLRNRSC